MPRIAVMVKPQARKAGIRQIAADRYVASVQAPAREGKANEALIELLAGHFQVPKSRVRIVHGHAGRNKLVDIG